MVSSTSDCTSSALVTSSRAAKAMPPSVRMASTASSAASKLMSAMTTTAPRRARSEERQRPIPDAPPVTIAILSLNMHSLVVNQRSRRRRGGRAEFLPGEPPRPSGNWFCESKPQQKARALSVRFGNKLVKAGLEDLDEFGIDRAACADPLGDCIVKHAQRHHRLR